MADRQGAGATMIVANFDDMNGSTAATPMNSVSRGATSFATNQVTVGTSATQIVPARAGRVAVTITNLGTTDIFLGGSGVTAGNGHLLLGSKGASHTIPTGAAVFGIAGAAQAVTFLETF